MGKLKTKKNMDKKRVYLPLNHGSVHFPLLEVLLRQALSHRSIDEKRLDFQESQSPCTKFMQLATNDSSVNLPDN